MAKTSDFAPMKANFDNLHYLDDLQASLILIDWLINWN